jgi:hypothetical protein
VEENTVNLFDSILDQIKIGKQRAKDIISSKSDKYEDIELIFRWQLCRIYNIPMFSEYFENRSLSDLVMEFELHRLANQTQEQQASAAIKESKEEIENLFSDFEAEDIQQAPPMSDEEFNKMKSFMESGKFIGEE